MGDLRVWSLQTPAMMRPTEVESGCRRLAWAVLWAPRRSPRPDMFQPLCSEVGARTVDGLPTQPGAVLGRRGLPARLLSRRCVPRAACVALRGPLLPRPGAAIARRGNIQLHRTSVYLSAPECSPKVKMNFRRARYFGWPDLPAEISGLWGSMLRTNCRHKK